MTTCHYCRTMQTASVVWSRDVAPRKANQLQMAARSAISEMENVKAQVFVLYRCVCLLQLDLRVAKP
jgi:hypothetical protein